MRRTFCLGVFTRFSGFGHNLPYPGSQQHQTSTSSSSPPPQQQQEQPQQQESEYRACNRNDEIATSFPSKLNEHYINWRSNSSSSSNLSNNKNNNRREVEYHNDNKEIDNKRNELGKTNNKYTFEDNNSVNAHLQQEQSASEVTTSTSTSPKTTISSSSSLSPKSPTSSSQYLQIYDRVGTDAFGAGGVIASARILYSQRERLDLKFLSNYLPDVYSLPHSLTSSSSSAAAAVTSQLSSTFNRTNSNIINSGNINGNAKHENSTMSNAVFASQNASRSVRGYSHHFLTHRNKRVFSSNNNIVNNINVTNISKEHERERDALKASVKVLHCKRRVTAYELKYYVKRERHTMSHQSSYHQANPFPVVFVERDVTSREEMYSSYEQIYQQYIEHRLTNATELLSHSEAPAPAIVLRRLLSERTPSLFLVQYALMAIIFSLQKTDNKSNNIRNNNNNNNNVSSVKYARNSGQTASSSISPLSSSSSSTSA